MGEIRLGMMIGIGVFWIVSRIYRTNKLLLANFLLKFSVGLLAVRFLNQLFLWLKIDLALGLNALTAGVAGLLGLPGILIMYGIILYLSL